MSPLARVAGLAAIAAGAFVAAASPATAAPSVPGTPSTQEASPTGETPSAAQTAQSPGAEQSAQESPTGSETPSAHGTPSAQDTQFLQESHQTNLAEIAAGHLAQQKGKSQTVKNLGAKFVTDHTKLDQSLKSVANSVGVSLPSTPNSSQQAVEKFDNLFVTSQFAGHTQAMQATQTEIDNGSDPKVVKLASDSLPVIESHHQALEAAAKQLGITLPTASPMPTGTATATPTPTPTSTPTVPEPRTRPRTNPPTRAPLPGKPPGTRPPTERACQRRPRPGMPRRG
jgi:putative membrane protein